ncbi:myosin class II heavy chain (MHC) [Hirsutella rhossiliensis]|uniref:Myosin class II heavy chain (MHC) n=1 Tax=Hirsutella rhossiliensis TaxID=111463 RepID=A0A9P8MZA0_9HYPO|nr:myosin class II heavy chain (MHC) [Hirsutella rhossiliensis]KAH0964052.1 myosin class II heavy chain (MHC) [Hirsutella rhossiliensis]
MSSAAKNPSTGANVEAGIGSRPLFFIHTSGNASRADAQRSLTLAQSKQVREPTREVRDSAAGDLSFVCADLACARAQDDPGHTYFSRSLSSPALSTTSTAHDGDDDLESFPAVPSLPTPSLPAWVADILRTPSPSAAEEFGTASWGSPYPESDHNLRRYSFSSETSDDSLIHHLNLDTPFLRSQPGPPQSESEPQSTVSAAAAVLANRARRRDRGLTEDWIRTHTTGIVNAEPKHWFSEGSETDHSSLSGSELGWLDSDLRTPRAASVDELSSSRQSRRPRGRSSVETLKPRDSFDLEAADTMAMATSEGAASAPDFAADEKMPRGEIEDAKPHVTPVKGVHKPLPKEPLMTPPIKKKVPWKGKNILVLIPRDDKRGLSGQSPMPLRSDEVDRMFASWKQLGYSVDGFDLLVEGYQPPGTDDSQSRQDWPSDADMAQERAGRSFKVTLPDLNAWKEYVNELQEAKLRALGFIPAAQSPGLPSGPSPVPFAAMPGKFNSRQSISLPAGPSPFQLRQPSPQSPYGIDGLQQAGSPAFNPHQRHQSMQYLPQHMTARASPRLQEVIEEEGTVSRSPSMTPEPTRQNPDSLQAEIDDAEYHLEEQLREQLEHEDYNPQTQTEPPAVGPNPPAPALGQDRNGPGDMAVAQSFANEPGKPLILHHPRPHSRGHSLSQSFFRDHIEDQKSPEEGGRHKLDALSEMPEAQKVQELQEIQTNPSEPGTPGKTFDFPTALGQHEKTLSTISNPWHDSVSATGSTRRSSHGSKQSLSTLNVEAPEFKFNPGNTFIPGSFNFSGNSFQPAVFQAGNAAETPSAKSVSQFSGSAKFHATAPSFSPGQSDFSFSAFGPMFRPDAPAFTPFHPLSGSITSPGGSSSDNAGNRSSIFGSIDIKANDIIKPAKKSKAIPIVRPSSISSVKSTKASKPVDAIHEAPEDQPLHESRVKRAWSAAPDGDDVPLFAERPEDAPPETAPDTARDEHSGGEDGSILEGDNALLADTSMSSIVTSDHNETKATTAASSEISPIGNKSLKDWAPFEFGTNFEAPNFGESRIFGDDSKKGEIAKPLSTTAEPPASIDDQQTKESASSQDKEAQPKLMPKGLGASRFASPPLPVDGLVASHFEEAASSVGIPESRPTESAKQDVIQSVEQDGTPAVEGAVEQITDPGADREPTFEEIDAVMQHLENNPSMGVNKSLDMSQWQPPTALMEADSPGADLQPPIDQFARDDPFIDPPASSHSPNLNNELDDAELESEPASDWEAAFSNEEHDKLESRAHFFDGRVNEVHALAPKSRRTPSSRRDMRSVSLEFQESDADDEDEELLPQRSMSPRRDRRMEHIRIAVTEAFAAQQRNQPPTSAAGEGLLSSGDPAILKTLGEIKEQLAAPTAARAIEPSKTAKGENEGQETPVPGTDEQILLKMQELQSKLVQFEDRLYQEQFNVEKAVAERRGAQDEAAELNRKLQAAETRVEVEIINRSVFDQRVADLEERLRQQEEKNEEEIKTRRAAEDRLSEVQRLLRISSEEETRLREVLDDRDEKIKSFEDASGKTAMQMALLEAAQTNSTQAQSEMTNKINALEADLKNVRQDNTHWRSEAERADEENKLMQKSLTTLTSQLEENERLRESWRGKFMTLQDDMGRAARDIAEENARRIKKDQAMLARQEVLDARLQAEAKTRERLEVEMERLQLNERSGMRAVNECKRLEGLLVELQTENYKVQQSASRYQREFEEARESGVSEVKRTRIALQTEIDAANNLVNVIREELEEHNSKAQNEMLLEEVQTLKVAEIEDIKRKHQNELEDVQTRFERQISNASEDAQKAEQQLLERLSLSSSKIEHLQDRIVHLEDKLDIAKEAAAAAAQAAKSAGAEPGVAATLNTAPPQAPSRQLDMPEKISPQALRESIMVLQEQLQAREQRIEELEQIAAKADPDAASKISKRDDEISWLRELLAVRHGDLQDIIAALSGARYDREAVKDAAIRLKANLQMEEQERERAMNGGSAIHLPNIAQSIQAATPRVAQTIGPIAAAWGNWRKSNQQSFRSISGVLNVPAGNNATPSKGRGRPDSQSNPLGGLLTPPTSSLRQSPLVDTRPQPTAFSSTGRRYTVQSSVPNRARGTPPRQQEHRELMTPPMMHDTGYDSDAQPGDFDDQDFFEEEDE